MVPRQIKTAPDVVSFIEGQPRMVALLTSLATLNLPDAWIGAGFVRNPVWDALHSRAPDLNSLADVDVIFFDAGNPGTEREKAIEAVLAVLDPGTPWSARNQARMHLRNDDPPYQDAEDGIRHWPETATAVAARIMGGRVELLAPYGVEDLVGLALRPTPTTAARPGHLEAYRKRIQDKGWEQRWPCLRMFGLG